MDRAHLALCLGAFDRATHSPIGKAYENTFAQHFSSEGSPPGLSRIREKLLDGDYPAISDYFKDLEDTVNALIRFLSPENELSVALSTVHEMILENSRTFSGRLQSNYITSLSTLTQSVKDFARRAPNTRDKFREFGRQIPRRERSDDKGPPPKPNISHIDVHQLKLMIQRLTKDEDERELVSLIVRYEPHFVHTVGTFEIDLKKLHPETLVRVWNYMIKKVPIPGKESPMKRIASAPAIAAAAAAAVAGRMRVLDPQKVVFRAPATNTLPETSPFLASLSPSRSPTPSPTPTAPKALFVRDRPGVAQLSPVLAKPAAQQPRVTIQTEQVPVKKEPEATSKQASVTPPATPPQKE